MKNLYQTILKIGDIQKILCNLLDEGVSIRNLETILETLADYGSITRDTNILTEYARQNLKRQISKLFFPSGNGRVVTIEQSLENKLMESIEQTESGSYLSIDPRSSQLMMNSLTTQIQKLVSTGELPIVVTAPIVRFYFKKVTSQIIPDLIVLSYNEIDENIEIQSIGMVSI